MRRCLACGEPLPADLPAHWRMHSECFLSRYGRQAPAPAAIPVARAAEALELDDEVLRLLLHVAHPDRHGGSDASTRATQFLLLLRDKLSGD